jgi:hypothetical protein
VAAAPYSLSLCLFFSYLSLISERPCGCCSLRALSLYLSPSIIVSCFRETFCPVICLLFQRDPTAAAPHYLCLPPSIICLLLQKDSVTYVSLLLLSVSCFRETLWLLLFTGPVSLLSPSFICLLFQRDLVAVAPYGPCLCLSPSIICL